MSLLKELRVMFKVFRGRLDRVHHVFGAETFAVKTGHADQQSLHQREPIKRVCSLGIEGVVTGGVPSQPKGNWQRKMVLIR